ncbi:hypothetical protein CsSME_00031557 [Camellia sinensis var. sinensis]
MLKGMEPCSCKMMKNLIGEIGFIWSSTLSTEGRHTYFHSSLLRLGKPWSLTSQSCKNLQ